MPDQAPLAPNDGYFVAQTLYLSSTAPALPAPRVSAQTEEQVRRIVNTAVLEAADNFMGMCGNPFDQGDLFNDLYGSWYSNPYFMPPYYWQSQKRGEVIPVYLNELQLRYIRDRQRKLCSENPYAQCAIAASQNYCVGEEGFVFQVVPASHHETNDSHIRQVQRIIDVWAEENDMPTYERDMVEMGIVNGDIITRHFPQKDGIVWIRTVQAEHLRSPTGEAYDAQHSFGIQTAAGDIENTEGYWIVDDPLTNPQPSYVPASQITFIKLNTPRSAKRGRPLFDGGCEILLRGAMELLRATMATVTSRAKIALIRKFNNVVKDAAAKMVTELTTQTVTDPNNGQQQNMSKMGYGTILNSSGQIEYEMPSQNFETNIHYQALQMVLRAVCARAQFPEFMLTADPSSGTFSNSFIAEAPSTKQFGSLQKMLAQHVGSNRRRRHRSMAWVQVVHAVECGLLHPDVLHTVQIETKGPGLVVRDKAGEAATNKTYSMEMRIKPPQMIQQELGIDPQVADKMWQEWDKKEEGRMRRQAALQAELHPPTPPGGTGEDGGDADGEGEDGDQGPPREPNDKPKPKPSGLQESHQETDADDGDSDHLQRFVWQADDVQFDEGEGLAEGLFEEVDAAGHQHKGKGAGGGQFTASAGGGAKSDKGSKSSGREAPNPVKHAVHEKAEDADHWAKTVIHQTEPLTKPEADAIAAYRKTKAVYEINNYLRATQAEVLAQRDSQDTAGYVAAAANKAKHKLLGVGKNNKQVVKDLDAAIAKSKTTEDMTVMRGMKLPKGSDMLQSFKPGRVITDHGFVSTTMASEVAERFALTSMTDHEGVTFAIHVPKGSNAYHMPRQVGEYNEAELVLPRGARFSVHSVEKVNGKTHVQLKYIGPSPSRPTFESLQFDAGKSIDTEDLAHLYAELWHGQHPRDVGEQSLATADAELSAGQHTLAWDEERGWHVVSPAATLEAALFEAVHRAPAGGVTINGKPFRPGEFIPAAAYKEANPAERNAIDNPAKAAADKRSSRGQVDEGKLRESVQPHAHHELTPQEEVSARRSLQSLRQHHGKLTLHRLEEIAGALQAAYDRTPADQDGRRTRISRRLKAIEYQLDVAKEPPKAKTNTLYKRILSGGGIDVEALKKQYNVKIEFIESGLLGLLVGDDAMAKRGAVESRPMGLDQWAQVLESEGHIQVPENRNADDYLLELLQKKTNSLHDMIESTMAAEDARYYRELEELHHAGADGSEIQEIIRAGEAAAQAEVDQGDAFEGLGELADSQGAGEIDFNPWDFPDETRPPKS